ncbi:Transposon Polyprotein Reverse transcriptase [Phytophthora megakarya]|uniref:Transposon Polyprotein Reverse transcriptase n=1 Tax=Phytophthora megakarya TaxID=4795 RepID=A0A225VPA2_9STRA|nr:Transposon Polyprotein Reverse transcriptase [Phytophthora megakarya]
MQTIKRSVTGCLLRLHGNMWMWKSHVQRRVTEDTCSSELVACCECSKMVIWAQIPVSAYCGNQSAIAVVANNGNTSRVQHMAKHDRFINEYVQAKALHVTYVSSAEHLADMFTKSLGPVKFERQRSRVK